MLEVQSQKEASAAYQRETNLKIRLLEDKAKENELNMKFLQDTISQIKDMLTLYYYTY